MLSHDMMNCLTLQLTLIERHARATFESTGAKFLYLLPLHLSILATTC